MIQDVIIQRKFTTNVPGHLKMNIDGAIDDEPGDEIDTLGLDRGPAGLLYIGGSLCEIISRDLASPVSLDGLLDFTVGT